MSPSGRRVLILATLWLLVLARPGWAAEAKEEEVPLDKVPKVVITSVKKKFPEANLQGAARHMEDKQLYYELLIKQKGHEIYVICEAAGKIVEIDREINPKDLPRAVFDALKKQYGKANILSIEEVTEGDEITYAVILKQNKKTLHVVFDPKGKAIEEETIDEKK
jgi:hypothetical protein